MAEVAAVSSGLFKPRVSSKMHPKVKGEDILAFFQQLSTLFRAGTPIYDAIVIASEQTQSTALSAVIADLAKKVAAGNALSTAMATHADLFRTEWTEIIRSGESSGQLDTMLLKLTAQIDSASQMRRKLVSAMMYPAIILVVAVLALTVMLVKVVPTFAGMFDTMGGELPGITQGVLAVSNFLQENGLLLFGGAIVAFFTVRRWLRTPDGRRAFDKFMVSVPAIGEVTVQSAMQKFAINVALLLRSGLPILEAIEAMHGIYTNQVYKDALLRVRQHVERGGPLAEGMERTGLFTTFMVSMARTGEASGTLPDVLDEVEIFYRRKVETVAERLASTLETVVILGMGVAVAVILCSVYLPMFSMAGGVG